MPDAPEQPGQPRPFLVRLAQTRTLPLFFVLTYLWTWMLWLVMAKIVPEGNISPRFEMFLEGLFAFSAFGPTVAALATNWLAHRSLKICRLWTGWRNLIQGLAIGLVAFVLVTLILSSAATSKSSPGEWHWSSLLHLSTYAINFSFFFGGPVNEEPGWRGFALPRLQARYGAVGATLILAPLWAGWHIPLFWMEGWTSASPWQYLLILIGISFLFTAAANVSNFNVIVAMALHAFFNTSSRLSNNLTANLPRRPHEMTNYTLVVLACGVTTGLAILAVSGKLRSRGNAVPLDSTSA